MIIQENDRLVSNFKVLTTSVCDWRCVKAFVDKDIYILQHFITGEIQSYTSAQLDIYFHFDPPR